MLIKIAFDFGITNTDIVIEKNNQMEFHSFPSEKVETSFILKILNDLKVDINQVTKIAVTGGKSSDLENSVNLVNQIPEDCLKISESGLSDPRIITGLKEYGFNGVSTVTKKVAEGKNLNLAGIMFWSLAGDLPIDHEKSLLKAMSAEVKR